MTHALGDGGHRQLKDTVYLLLRDDIVNGALPPGAVLREAELAARFGVSKTPLRDALVRLQKDGFVEIPPYRSAVVVGYSRTDLREIYELRELLEGACARQAAFHISVDALAELARIVRASAECTSGEKVLAGREEELASLLDQFDLVMYAQARNGRIDEMVGNIRGHIQRIGRLTAGIPGRLAKSVPEHQAIYEAIVQRDGAAAETLMRRHILSVMADQLTNIEVTDAG
ncbi:MAG TPA: GntR family transcriptional regulator [Streptosporangiaceae bacterium]|nr:GntR family transcriptional regulator [Streptosporangiaceae bacterium]